MSDERKNLSYRKILIFWLPLAYTWLMMSVEGPFLSALIARMPDPKFNLAAYGVAFSLALIIEAPIIMVMSATTKLARDMVSFDKMKKFVYSSNILLTLFMLILVSPVVFEFVAIDLMELPLEIANLTHIAVAILIPWPGAIGYRRFYQGVLIRMNKTGKVAYGTVIRLIAMSSAGLILYFLIKPDGVIVGAGALSAGVIAEAVASKFMCASSLKKLENYKIAPESRELTYGGIINFYYPLALTSILTLGVHPMVTFFMSQSRMAIESLAVLTVINSFLFIFRSFGLSYQEVGLALTNESKNNYIKLRNFAAILGVSLTAVLIVVSATPLAQLWFSGVSGLSKELTEFSLLPLAILTIMPALTTLISFQRSVLMDAKITKPITIGTSLEVVGIFLSLSVLINYMNAIGVIAAAVSFLIGRAMANIYLAFPFNKAVKRFT